MGKRVAYLAGLLDSQGLRETPVRNGCTILISVTPKRLNRRGFGEVYKALDKDSGTYVAIKEMRLTASDAKIQSESEMLMKCNSPFIVRYKGVIRNGNKLWVRY